MASSAHAALGALVALAFWTLVGFAITRALLPRALTLPAAPVLGWAAHNVVALPLFMLAGFSTLTVVGFAVLVAIFAAAAIVMGPARVGDAKATVPLWAYAVAAALALAPAVAIVPKFDGDAVHVAAQIFDHAKVAMVDAMARLGVPPPNPFFGALGVGDRLPYYYLWHFSAAQLSLALGISGWEADIAMTWVSAFASLTLMMGLAVWLGGRSAAAIWAVLLASAGSLRATGMWIVGERWQEVMHYPVGFAGWLFQSAWVPQHIMSATCVVLAVLLLIRLAERQTVALTIALALVVAAGFESSAFVGGVTFAFVALLVVPLLWIRVDPAGRPRFSTCVVAAAVLAVGLAAPFVLDQIAAVRLREAGAPIALDHFEVFGTAFPLAVRRVLDLPGYWLVLLPIEFPAAYLAGALALYLMFRSRKSEPDARRAIAALIALVVASLAISWLLVSTIGGVNDLGLRAVLPGLIVLIAAAAAGIASALSHRRMLAALALGGLALSLPETVTMISYYARGGESSSDRVFARTPQMWAAVRRHTGIAERVANNPLFLADLTPWPINLSWALLSQRNSCFAGADTALPFVPLPHARRDAIDAQFIRVFEGAGSAQDVTEMATTYGCAVVVLTAEDKAWGADPFAAHPSYRLVEASDGRWRIYRAVIDGAAR